MQVLVVRHAIAEQREEFARTGKDDSQRPLTHDGRRKMRRGAVGLRAVVPAIDVLATSPLLRAVQTAEILAAVYNGRNMVTVKGALSRQRVSPVPPVVAHAGCRRHGRDRGARAASIRSHQLAVDRAQAVVCLPQEGCSVPAGVRGAAESRRSDGRVGTHPVPASATRRVGRWISPVTCSIALKESVQLLNAVLFYKTPQRPSDILLTRINLETLHDFRMELPRLRSCLRANGEALEDSVPNEAR